MEWSEGRRGKARRGESIASVCLQSLAKTGGAPVAQRSADDRGDPGHKSPTNPKAHDTLTFLFLEMHRRQAREDMMVVVDSVETTDVDEPAKRTGVLCNLGPGSGSRGGVCRAWCVAGVVVAGQSVQCRMSAAVGMCLTLCRAEAQRRRTDSPVQSRVQVPALSRLASLCRVGWAGVEKVADGEWDGTMMVRDEGRTCVNGAEGGGRRPGRGDL